MVHSLLVASSGLELPFHESNFVTIETSMATDYEMNALGLRGSSSTTPSTVSLIDFS
jgi:hypothetical protein